jgi:2-oxoglutarate ferredoxin oxidoreductase subunit alpha
VELPEVSELKLVNRKTPTDPPETFQAYRPDADEVPPMAAFGEGYYHHVTGLMHGYSGLPTASAAVTNELARRLESKITRAQDEITLYTEDGIAGADVVLVSYGGSSRAASAAMKMAREQGAKVGMLKLITIWPFPAEMVMAKTQKAKTIIVPELNTGQLVGEVERYVGRDRVVSVTRVDGELFKPEEILEAILAAGGAK